MGGRDRLGPDKWSLTFWSSSTRSSLRQRRFSTVACLVGLVARPSFIGVLTADQIYGPMSGRSIRLPSSGPQGRSKVPFDRAPSRAHVDQLVVSESYLSCGWYAW
jgi:hypothetical protein